MGIAKTLALDDLVQIRTHQLIDQVHLAEVVDAGRGREQVEQSDHLQGGGVKFQKTLDNKSGINKSNLHYRGSCASTA